MTKEGKRESGETTPKINDYLKVRRLLERMMKMGDMIERIKTLLENVPGIQYAFIYNPFRRDLEDHEPEVDVVVLGGPDLAEMDEAISKAEEELGSPFLITPYSVRKIRERIRVKDEAISRALKSPKIMLLDNEEELRPL